MSKINSFYSKKKLQGTRCHKSVIFLEWCMTHCPIKWVCSTPSFSWVIDRVHRSQQFCYSIPFHEHVHQLKLLSLASFLYLIAVLIPMVMGRFLITCYDNSFMLMILASVYLQLHLYGPIVNKSHQKKEILIQT
jgi:hypothetical protein